MRTKRHVQPVRCLQLVKTVLAEKPVNFVISGGLGFQQRPGYSAPTKGNNYLAHLSVRRTQLVMQSCYCMLAAASGPLRL